jgi:hypothetical protein
MSWEDSWLKWSQDYHCGPREGFKAGFEAGCKDAHDAILKGSAIYDLVDKLESDKAALLEQVADLEDDKESLECWERVARKNGEEKRALQSEKAELVAEITNEKNSADCFAENNMRISAENDRLKVELASYKAFVSSMAGAGSLGSTKIFQEELPVVGVSIDCGSNGFIENIEELISKLYMHKQIKLVLKKD